MYYHYVNQTLGCSLEVILILFISQTASQIIKVCPVLKCRTAPLADSYLQDVKIIPGSPMPYCLVQDHTQWGQRIQCTLNLDQDKAVFHWFHCIPMQ